MRLHSSRLSEQVAVGLLVAGTAHSPREALAGERYFFHRAQNQMSTSRRRRRWWLQHCFKRTGSRHSVDERPDVPHRVETDPSSLR